MKNFANRKKCAIRLKLFCGTSLSIWEGTNDRFVVTNVLLSDLRMLLKALHKC